MKFIKEKSFYRMLMAVALPIALQNLVVLANSMMDTIMLGLADDTGILLSASSLAGQPLFLLQLFVFGLSSAGSVLTAQYWGKKDMASIRKIISIVLKIAVLVGAIVSVLVVMFPENAMRLYSDNEQRIQTGAKYLSIMGWGYVAFAFAQSLICSIRSVELVGISFVTNLISFAINVFLNWVLIFGNLGFPPLGIEGAAIASLVARIVEALVIGVYIFAIDKRIGFRFRHLFSFDKTLSKDLMKNGLPVLLNELMWGLGISVQASVLGHIDYSEGDPVAANSIMSIVQQLATVFVFGISNAAAVIIGKSIGQNEGAKTITKARTLQLLSVLAGLMCFVLIMLIKAPIISIYSLSAETKELADQMITVIAFITIFVSTSSMMIMGTLRGAGDTKFCLWAEMGCLWGVATPLSALLGLVLKIPVPLVLIGMKLDEPLKTLLCFIRMRGSKWVRAVARDFKEETEAPLLEKAE